MRRTILLVTVAAVMAAMMALSGVAWAAEGPTPNGHNCGGTSSFEGTHGPGGGEDFGTAVGDYASSGGSIPPLTVGNCESPGP